MMSKRQGVKGTLIIDEGGQVFFMANHSLILGRFGKKKFIPSSRLRNITKLREHMKRVNKR